MVPAAGGGQAWGMTTNPPESPATQGDPTPDGPRVTREQARDLGRLRRSVTDRHVGGVAGGLARHFDIDPVILRVAFVVLGVMGPGILLYGAFWLLVPEDGKDRATIPTDEGLRSVLLIIATAISLLGLIGNSWEPFWFPWQLLVVGLVAWWLLSRRERRQQAWVGETPEPTPYARTQPPGWVGEPAASAPAAPPEGPGWVAPTAPPGTPSGRPRDPRKRGPRLFWYTLGVVAVALGALGMADLAGADVVDSAYPALALGVIAAMLLLGAFWGRAGGLILLGVIATLALLGSTVTEHWDGGHERNTPLTAADVDDEYWLQNGELIVDLTQVADPAALDDRRIEVGVGAGRVEVIVPDDVRVDVDAEVGGPGNVQLFGDEHGGIHVEDDATHGGRGSVADLEIDAFVGVGEIVVTNR